MRYSHTLLMIFCFLFTQIATSQSFQGITVDAPLSFRSQALGGAVFDNLDLVYDPIELRFVDGVRIYTNLSNLTSSSEQILNGVSDNEFLMGISFKNGLFENYWTSFLVRFSNSRSSNIFSFDPDLDGLANFTKEGQFRDIYTAFLDNNGDGLYDIKRVIDQQKTSFDKNKMGMIIFNNSFANKNWIFGLRLAYGKRTSESTVASGFYGSHTGPLIGAIPGDPTVSLNFDLFSVADNFRSFNQNENGDFLNTTENRFFTLQFAAMGLYNVAGIKRVELRTDLAYLTDRYKFFVKDNYAGAFENFSQDIPGYKNVFSEEFNREDVTEDKENGFLAGFSAKRVFARGLERKDDGFWQVRLGIRRLSLDYRANTEDAMDNNSNFFDGIDTLNSDFSDANQDLFTTSDEGNGSTLRYFASTLVNYPLGNQVHLGIGIQFLRDNLNRTTQFAQSQNTLQNFEQIDTLTSNDFQRTSSVSSAAEHTFEQTLYRISVPVGIEYKFTTNQKWSLRFGSIFTYRRIIANDALEITDAQPLQTVTEFGDGTSDITLSDNIFESTSSHTKTGASETTFVYGLGFTPTEHLQIDLLGFLGTTEGLQIWDVDFLRSLRLSFSLKL